MCFKHGQPDSCGAKQVLLVTAHCKKEQDVAEEGGQVGKHFSGTNLIVLAPGDDYSTIQYECKNEVKKWLQGDQDHQ